MRIFQIYLVFIILFLSGCSLFEDSENDCLPKELKDKTIGVYLFSEGSLKDESAFENHLDLSSAAVPTFDRNGNPKCAYLFDNPTLENSNEYLSKEEGEFLNNLASFSISLWYQPSLQPNESEFETLWSRGDNLNCPDKVGEWSVGLYDCRRTVFGHNNSVWAEINNPSYSDCGDEDNLVDSPWHHVVAIKDESSYSIYKNGTLHEFVEGNANCGVFQEVKDVGSIFIGKNFSGKIDDIFLFNDALSEEEILALYNLPVCCD